MVIVYGVDVMVPLTSASRTVPEGTLVNSSIPFDSVVIIGLPSSPVSGIDVMVPLTSASRTVPEGTLVNSSVPFDSVVLTGLLSSPGVDDDLLSDDNLDDDSSEGSRVSPGVVIFSLISS